MDQFVLVLRDLDRSGLALAGGKGANLGELCRIDGLLVPGGFCVTTEAYKRVTGKNAALDSLLDELAGVKVSDLKKLGSTCAAIRCLIEDIPIPAEIVTGIAEHFTSLGQTSPYAVRSSATAEDLPTASFAGQQDSFLNVVGLAGILKHVSKCWASLFTDRAVIYRMQNGFDHRQVSLAVVVQKMVDPFASGILFTADPVTGNRKIVSIDAGFGLGEALVSGVVSADCYKVRGNELVEKRFRQKQQPLTDEQIVSLAQIGRRIEAHFGRPQDIEWCLLGEDFYFVQSRPITTLFPIPDAGDSGNHVYVSVGHQQMMTDAFRPLGISLWQHTTARPMPVAGGRLFVDVAPELASPAKRDMLVNVLGKSDPLIRGALMNILERGDFIEISTGEAADAPGAAKGAPASPPPPDYTTLNNYDPAIVGELIGKSEASIAELKREIAMVSGQALIPFILNDLLELKKLLFDRESFGVFMTAMNASHWLNEKMKEWLGEKNVADTLTLSVSDNITSEMGRALLDVADVIRPHPEMVEFLQRVKNDSFLNENSRLQQEANDFLDELPGFRGGDQARAAILSFLDKYGMRCAGEIDITKPRWSENPAILVPMILSNIRNLSPGGSDQKLAEGRQLALQKEQELLARLLVLPNGEEKARETKRMIDLVRNLIGYREYPKYSKVKRYFVYKQALLKEAERLVAAGVIREKEDIYFLSLEELGEAIRTDRLDPAIIALRKEEYRAFEKLSPPRVFTSDGEIVSGRYNREGLPPCALAGIAVSSGTIEGRARVVMNISDANFEEGDILVTAFTDPSWTPLFLSIKGLVTEVGGLMTHGAVIAREYGLPAVVGVEEATRLIKDGQRIRVNGTDGYVELL